MNKMVRKATKTTFDGRSQVCDVTYFNDVTKTVRKRRQQLHARIVRGFVAFCVCPLEEKLVNKSCFSSIFEVQTVSTPISRLDKLAKLFKINFTPLV